MPATTIKLEADLVKKIKALKSTNESISKFVRQLIEREHRGREHLASAVMYHRFLGKNPDELAAMNAWEAAPLAKKVRLVRAGPRPANAGATGKI